MSLENYKKKKKPNRIKEVREPLRVDRENLVKD